MKVCNQCIDRSEPVPGNDIGIGLPRLCYKFPLLIYDGLKRTNNRGSYGDDAPSLLARQIEHFGAVIRGEVKPLVSARDGCENLRITNAIVVSSHTGLTIHTGR